MQTGHDARNLVEGANGRTTELLMAIFLAGVAGEVVLEAIAWFVAPSILGVPMRPFLLVEDLGRQLFGATIPTELSVTVHLLLGAVVMPLGYVGLKRWSGWTSWLWASSVWGIILWLIAQAVLAPLAGRPFFLGFGAYSWASLVVHVVYAIVVGYVLNDLKTRFRTRP
ncbi:hypothetical protein [Stappia sp.]|uniref:hypothetical protein n=1 Tax=Stappia sp. TaxID=1870903 RepID=UPI003A997A08